MVLAYLSGPIIISENRKDAFYKTVIEVLQLRSVEVFAPQFLPPADATIIYRRDVDALRKSSMVIAEISDPSHGVGMEIMLAIELKKPLILFHRKDELYLSKMVIGASGSAIFEYASVDEVAAILQSMNLSELVLKKCSGCPSHIAARENDIYWCVRCGKRIS
ncbi:MAG: hypothetical protein EAX81_05185 [Candidatus Thorarchaeota archaeon]|nr:hypothetical protein [Candidatus Thorarchaeota archaeon]